MAGFLGSGNVYADRKVSGISTGKRLIGNATKFEVKENSEKKERVSKQTANYGSALNTVYVKKPAEVNLTLDDLDKENLALVFLGESSAVSVTGSAVTGEVQTGYIDRILNTDFRNISAVVVKDVTDTTTYVLGTDYSIDNAQAGFIKVLSGGSISDGDVLHIDYTYGNMISDKVLGGTDSTVIVELTMIGVNQADQSNAIVEVYEAVLSPTTGVDFLSDDFTSIELAGTANVPTGGNEAYAVQLNVVYS